MKQPDFEQARRYALERLEQELSLQLVYHSLWHTRDDVAPAAERLAALEGVTGEDLLLLKTAAFYHDIGFIERRVDHEEAGARIAAEVLPGFGYNPMQIELIRGMILATKVPQSPTTRLEQILADADLDVLGREDVFLLRLQNLRDELAAFGVVMTDEEWYNAQLKFLQAHRYFTPAARSLRDTQKKHNLEIIIGLVGQFRSGLAKS